MEWIYKVNRLRATNTGGNIFDVILCRREGVQHHEKLRKGRSLVCRELQLPQWILLTKHNERIGQQIAVKTERIRELEREVQTGEQTVQRRGSSSRSREHAHAYRPHPLEIDSHRRSSTSL